MNAMSRATTAGWVRDLRERLRDRNLAAVARALGWHETRLATMLGRQAVPNAIDAAKLCRYLGTTVEDVFGDGGAPAHEPGAAGRQRPEMAAADGAAARAARRRVVWRAYRLDAGRYQPERSIHLAGEAAVLEPEDVRDRRGLVPLLAPVAAGRPRVAHDQDYSVGAAEAFVRFDAGDERAFALRVDGDSMSPDFRHGDIIIAAPGAGAKHSPYTSGMLAVTIFSSERIATFKLVDFARGGAEIAYYLKPINKAHVAMRVAVADIKGIYPVVGWLRREEDRT